MSVFPAPQLNCQILGITPFTKVGSSFNYHIFQLWTLFFEKSEKSTLICAVCPSACLNQQLYGSLLDMSSYWSAAAETSASSEQHTEFHPAALSRTVSYLISISSLCQGWRVFLRVGYLSFNQTEGRSMFLPLRLLWPTCNIMKLKVFQTVTVELF